MMQALAIFLLGLSPLMLARTMDALGALCSRSLATWASYGIVPAISPSTIAGDLGVKSTSTITRRLAPLAGAVDLQRGQVRASERLMAAYAVAQFCRGLQGFSAPKAPKSDENIFALIDMGPLALADAIIASADRVFSGYGKGECCDVALRAFEVACDKALGFWCPSDIHVARSLISDPGALVMPVESDIADGLVGSAWVELAR